MPLRKLVAADHVAVVITDPRLPDNPVVECNEKFLELTGYERHEVIGRNCRFLSGPATDPDRRKLIRDAIEDQRPIIVELLNYRKDGTPFLNSLMIAPIHDVENALVGFVGSQIPVSTEENAFINEREMRARVLASQLSARQREVLSLIAKGKRIKQISYELEVSERTVKMHRSAMLKALDVRTNAEAIRIAVRAGI